METSTSTFPQAYIFFVPNIYDLAEMLLTWETNIFAVADVVAEAAVEAAADAATDLAEKNW